MVGKIITLNSSFKLHHLRRVGANLGEFPDMEHPWIRSIFTREGVGEGLERAWWQGIYF